MTKHIFLTLLSVMSFAATSQAGAPAVQVQPKSCAGEAKCVESEARSLLTAMIEQRAALYKKMKAVNDSTEHYQCYGEVADPFGEVVKQPNITFVAGSSDNEFDQSSSEYVYTNELIASIAMPSDCNEGGIVHNWNPRLLIKVTLEEKITHDEKSSFKIKWKELK